MGKLFKSSEGIFVGKVQHFLMRLDHPKVEGHNPIEENLIGSKPRAITGLIGQDLLDCRGRFCHARSPSERRYSPGSFAH